MRDREFGFVTVFNPETGGYLRTGVLDERGRDTGRDPFMASFPHLLDVGIMGHCLHGLSGRCADSLCYQSGRTTSRPNMSLADFRWLAEQCAGRVHQFALGGRGDPELHEDFEAIAACCREHGIVPNLTTSGFGLDEARAKLIRQYCGAAAVSWYRSPYTWRALELLIGLGVKTNIHYVLSAETIDEALGLLRGQLPPVAGVNKIIFLLFKPVGQGSHGPALQAGDPRLAELGRLIAEPGIAEYVGFDSCTVPAVINHSPGIDPRSYDTCEGGRFSAYVTPDLEMVPCSFDQELRYAQRLRPLTIAEAWRSPAFDAFRERLQAACPSCQDREVCMGGCPLLPEIVLCAREARTAEFREEATL